MSNEPIPVDGPREEGEQLLDENGLPLRAGEGRGDVDDALPDEDDVVQPGPDDDA